jgi:tetratricopeptide (TPR) repeat protein
MSVTPVAATNPARWSASGQRRAALGLVLLVTLVLCSRQIVAAVLWNRGYVELLKAAQPGSPLVDISYTPPQQASPVAIERALGFFQSARGWWPSAEPARLGLGVSLTQQQRYAEAAATLDEPGATSDQRIGLEAGTVQMLLGDRQQALDRWVAATPGLFDRLALTERMFGQSTWDDYHPDRWADAQAILEATMTEPSRTSQDVALLHQRLADMYEHADAYDRAIVHLEALLRSNPQDGFARATLAWVFWRQNRLDDAFREATAALPDGGGWRAHFIRGTVLLARCQLPEAATDLETGLTERPDEYRFSWQQRALGQVYWAHRSGGRGHRARRAPPSRGSPGRQAEHSGRCPMPGAHPTLDPSPSTPVPAPAAARRNGTHPGAR